MKCSIVSANERGRKPLKRVGQGLGRGACKEHQKEPSCGGNLCRFCLMGCRTLLPCHTQVGERLQGPGETAQWSIEASLSCKSLLGEPASLSPSIRCILLYGEMQGASVSS